MKLKIILIIFIVIVALGAVIYIVSPESFKSIVKFTKIINLIPEKPQVIEEKLVIPETQKITGGEGRAVNQGPVAVPLVPKSEGEKVVVSKAVLTAKGSYGLAKSEAEKWSADAKLVFIKSLGAVTLEGKSSQWQLAFSSKVKTKKGYEVIIQADQIVSQKEIDSGATGADLPGNWKDSGATIQSLQELPQFSDATVSSINLYYNADGKVWRYALSTSRGITSMSAEY